MRRIRRRAALAALGVLLAPSVRGQTAQATRVADSSRETDRELVDLFRRLAQEAPRPRRFVERRYSPLYVAPEESRGVLRFEPPATFEKRTESPAFEVLRLDGSKATVQRGQSAPVSLALDAHPALSSLAQGLRAAISGDLAALQATFNVSLSREDERWRVTAMPRDRNAGRFLARMEFAGTGSRLELVALHERSGDRSELWLIDEAPRR